MHPIYVYYIYNIIYTYIYNNKVFVPIRITWYFGEPVGRSPEGCKRKSFHSTRIEPIQNLLMVQTVIVCEKLCYLACISIDVAHR